MKNLRVLKSIFLLTSVVWLSHAQSPKIYIHKAVDSTLSNHTSKINSSDMDEKMNMFPVFTHNFNPGGGSGHYQTNHLGIYYYGGKWRLYDEDLNAFIKNSSYNVLLPGEGTMSWVHTTTESNVINNYTVIDHPKFNGKTDVQLYVSHMYNVNGEGSGKYHKHNIGVFYSKYKEKWCIYNEDLASMGKGLNFNVVFVPSSSNVTRFEHVVEGGNTAAHVTRLDHKLLNNNPNAKIIVSHMYNSGGEGGTYNDHPLGVYYNGTKWCIFNNDKNDMPLGATFFVLIANDKNPATTNKTSMELPSLRVSPNPVTRGEQITLSLYNEFNENLALEVVDLQGKLVYNKSLNSSNVVMESVPTKNLPKGIYLIRLHSNKIHAVRRVIIK